MIAKVFTDALGSDLWEETRKSEKTLLSPGHFLKMPLKASLFVCITQYKLGDEIILQFGVSQSDRSDFPGEAVKY